MLQVNKKTNNSKEKQAKDKNWRFTEKEIQ